MTIGYGELRKGMPIDLDGEPYQVVEYERNKMQQRAPVTRIRFRSLRTGRVTDRTFQGDDVKLIHAAIERRKAQYIYRDESLYYFMDDESYDQFPLSADQLSDSLDYLIEQINVDLIFYEGQPISIELPTAIDMTVSQTDPGFKGDTAQGATKPATMETGLVVQVPLFVNEGDKIKVDTRNGNYLARA